MKARLKMALGVVGPLLVATAAAAQSYALDSQMVGSGGGTSTGGVYSVNASVGQPVAGSMSGGPYTIDAGFWSVIGPAPTAAGERVINGSFENLSNSFIADVYGLMSLPAGSTAIPGWTTLTAELAWVSNTNTFGAATPFGTFSLELTGYHDSQPYGGVMQTITTSPGQAYRLSLALASNADYAGAGGQKVVSVTIGATDTTVTFTPTNATGNAWQTFAVTFTATSGTTVIAIGGLSSGGGIYLGLDAVSVVPLTPVPTGLRITAAERVGNDLRLSYTAGAGSHYAIQSREALDSGEWAVLPGSTNAGAGQRVTVTVTNALNAERRFYRVQRLP